VDELCAPGITNAVIDGCCNEAAPGVSGEIGALTGLVGADGGNCVRVAGPYSGAAALEEAAVVCALSWWFLGTRNSTRRHFHGVFI
jgi:hypothetical protein